MSTTQSPRGMMRGLPNVQTFGGDVGISRTGQRASGLYACPAIGPLKYVTDALNNVINVYTGKFNEQTPCGQLTGDLTQPQSLYVDVRTHDLYVANTGGFDVVVFHRGQTTPFNTYTDPDPNRQYPLSIVVAKDGTVIASNYHAVGGPEMGSLSTWIEGPNGGTFVGNFPYNDYGQGRYIAINEHDSVYYSDFELGIGGMLLWNVTCPLGHCGHQRQVAGVSFIDAFGMVFTADGDLIVEDTQPGKIETFELPNPTPSSFFVMGSPDGLAINPSDQHLYIANGGPEEAEEYTYPGGVLIGTVPGGIGVAVDP